MANFSRFSREVKLSNNKRVESVTIALKIENTTGSIWYTDIQFQEGETVTGYERNTRYMDKLVGDLHWHNGIIRSEETVIIFNVGGTSTALDVYIYPKQNMRATSINIAQGYGSHNAIIIPAVWAGDEVALLASTKTCTINNLKAEKQGFYKYTAAADSKHPITLQNKTGATVYFEYREKAGA
ncbi:MAG: hypothetical protein LBQ68_00795 [Clostridiales bacterium]|jgi:hypothetical protein|nr:hypothetical protein [Clostridiales bacterium]